MYILQKQADKTSYNVKEIYIDTLSELDSLSNLNLAPGSKLTVLEDFSKYIFISC